MDRFGGTPLDDAYRHDHMAVVTMIQAKGGKRGIHAEVIDRSRRQLSTAREATVAHVRRAAAECVAAHPLYHSLQQVQVLVSSLQSGVEQLELAYERLLRHLQVVVSLALVKKKRLSSVASLMFKVPTWFPLAEVYTQLVTGDGHRAVTEFTQQLSALTALLDTCRSPVLQRRLHPATLLQLHGALKLLSLGMDMMKVRVSH